MVLPACLEYNKTTILIFVMGNFLSACIRIVYLFHPADNKRIPSAPFTLSLLRRSECIHVSFNITRTKLRDQRSFQNTYITILATNHLVSHPGSKFMLMNRFGYTGVYKHRQMIPFQPELNKMWRTMVPSSRCIGQHSQNVIAGSDPWSVNVVCN
jgi:hypothetical protein